MSVRQLSVKESNCEDPEQGHEGILMLCGAQKKKQKTFFTAYPQSQWGILLQGRDTSWESCHSQDEFKRKALYFKNIFTKKTSLSSLHQIKM